MGSDDVLAAVRSVGKGRVALWSINSYFTFFRPYTREASFGENHHGAIDGILLHKGDGNVPADDAQLLVNLYHWLAQPGMSLGFGGPTPAALPTPPAPETSVTPTINWDTLKMPPPGGIVPSPRPSTGSSIGMSNLMSPSRVICTISRR